MSNETKKDLRQHEGLGAESCSSSSGRVIACCFCGAGFRYSCDSAFQEAFASAMAHEKQCEKNPYLEIIENLYDAIRNLEMSKDLYSKHFAEKRLFRLLPANAGDDSARRD